MFLPDFFKRLETTNNHWPPEVFVLYSYNNNFVDPSIPSDPEWPTTMNAWVAYHFRSMDSSSNYAAQLDWWTIYNILCRWENNNPQDYRRITKPDDYFKVALWNKRMMLRYNTTWAFFGYTDNQDQIALIYADHLHSPEGYAQLEASRGPIPTHQNQYGTFTDYPTNTKEAKPIHGKKETSSPWGKPIICKKVIHRIPTKK